MTTFSALAVSAVALLVYEVRNYGAFLLRDATTQAELLADITAPALQFDDPAAAKTNLELLGRRQDIDAAAIYSADGTLFASYARLPDTMFPSLGVAGSSVEGRTLTVFQPIVRNEEVFLGSVYLRSSYDIGDRLLDYLLILLGVMVPSFLFATLISLWLAGGVTNPVRALTDVARHIERRDFARRAPRTTDDEIGVFVDAFNSMVAEVGQRAEALEASNRALQQETEERRQAEIALRRADQRKDEFLATLAHELRNPLAPMVTSMTLLEQPALGAGAAERAHAIIRRQLAQMVRLVDDLLDVSRITSGKLVVRQQPVELAHVVQSAVDTARPLLDKLGQSLTVKLPRDPVYLQGDAVRLSQVFANLLNNAARYSEPGQQVSLRAAMEGDSVRVVVADRGMGIAPEMLETIFDMFMQGEENDRAQGGLGVGLSLARRLVELHGGTIVAESGGKGQGSTFTVMLPATTMPPARQSPSPEKTAASKPHRILLVDDNVDFATSMSTLLQRLGHEVRIAHDAAAALEVARELRPELGFLDLGLPDKNGYELATELRAQPETASTVLVAVSGWGQPRDRERSREAGFAMHLVKPVELQGISAAIAALVQDE